MGSGQSNWADKEECKESEADKQAFKKRREKFQRFIMKWFDKTTSPGQLEPKSITLTASGTFDSYGKVLVSEPVQPKVTIF